MFTRFLGLTVGFLLATICPLNGFCIEPEQLKEKVLAGLLRIEKYPAGVVKGRIKRLGDPNSDWECRVHFRGDKVWMERDVLEYANEEKRNRVNSVYLALGIVGVQVEDQFDGKKHRKFDPYNLTYTEKSVSSEPLFAEQCCFLPKYWLRMGASRTSYFRLIIERTKYETTIENLGNGRWKLSQKNMGADIPAPTRVAIRNRYIIVDEKCDFLVVEYFGEGDQGKLAGTLEWANQDGYWYAKNGMQTFGEKPWSEWQISEISFDESKCRTRFDDLESAIPFATKIVEENQKGRAISTKYKGGEDGETEFKLRNLAKLKIAKATP